MKDLKEIIRDLSEYDSATVQNSMILIRGFTSETQDYTGPSLKSFYLGQKPVVGIAITAKVTPLNKQKTVIDWDNYYDEVAKCDLPVIGVLQDMEKDKGRAAIMGDGMAHKHKALGAVGVIAEGNYGVGNYSWNWNAENLASGAYFISTQIGNEISQQKVTLIK